MDHRTDSRAACTSTAGGGSVSEPDLPLSGDGCPTPLTEGTILLQLVEFKSHLVEVVEELHIRRDAETRFEDQISHLVLDKQELEWEKESLQLQAETAAKRHAEALVGVTKQFQGKIKSLEEEKGKYQVSVELKDKEINNLKDELKSLQLVKYNLEKKTSELEQKLALQSKSKDSHLNQLGEVEKRFGLLSRQCAAVKQAHEKLERNVDEAIKRNEALTSAKAKQEATIASLQKELEDANHKLIKVKMSAAVKDEGRSSAEREQRLQQLQQRLHTETKVNKALMEESVSAREEKQEVMRCLEFTQQLLLSQTQAVSRVELQLQTQREQHQALKQEHEVALDGSRAAQDKLARLMESLAAARTSWAEEKAELSDAAEAAQQELEVVNRAHEELRRAHEELRSQAAAQASLLRDLEKKSNQGCLLCEPSACSAALKPESLRETGGGASPAAGVAAGGQVSQVQQYQQQEPEQPSNSSDLQANSKNEPEALRPPDSLRKSSVCEALSKSAADCSPERPRDDRDDAGRTAGRSGDTTQSVPEHEEGEEDGAAGSEDDGQSGGETEDGAEERRKTEPLVPQTLIPTQTAADTHQVVDLGDAGGRGGGGGEGGGEVGPLTTPQWDSRTVGGDAEQPQPTGRPDLGGDAQQRREADGSASMESSVEQQVPPDEGEGSSEEEEERQLVGASATPRHHPDACVTAGGRAAQSEFSSGAEEDQAAPDEKEVKEEEEKEAQSSQCRAGSLLPDRGCSAKTPLRGDQKSAAAGGETSRLPFDWRSVQRTPQSPRKSHDLNLHKFVQGPTLPEQNTCGLPVFLRDKHNLTPTSTSVPLQFAAPPLRPSPSSAPSATIFPGLSGSADSSLGRPQEHGDGNGGAREPAAPENTEHRDTGSTSSSHVFSRPPPTTLSRPSRAPSSAGLSSSNTEVSFSQEQEAQQSALRAQISKIEQFLNTERLRSVKRPRSDS